MTDITMKWDRGCIAPLNPEGAPLTGVRPVSLPEGYMEWDAIQTELKSRLVLDDSQNWIGRDIPLRYIGGVDISFVQGSSEDACACLVVLRADDMKVMYERCCMVKLTQPYIPGYLAFREVDHLVDLIQEYQHLYPTELLDVIFVDGNGILHPKGLGLASHLGVLVNIPTIGIAKKFFHIDGLDKKIMRKMVAENCTTPSSHIPIVGESGRIWGAAFISTPGASNPIYISIGHAVSLETAIDITRKTCKYRVPEAVRLADLKSREAVRKHESIMSPSIDRIIVSIG